MSLFTVLHTLCLFFFFFFNDTATTEIYTLSLHDALPICSALELYREYLGPHAKGLPASGLMFPLSIRHGGSEERDRKSTRLNSSHANISYAVFCLKKKKKKHVKH